ncbi:hypothetical protein, partial [Porphyromonas macacae]|uniref:hypothetical protein n=1 Tax=Porphyromonas macacae TaxID=28115 RepID=UPI001F1D87EC
KVCQPEMVFRKNSVNLIANLTASSVNFFQDTSVFFGKTSRQRFGFSRKTIVKSFVFQAVPAQYKNEVRAKRAEEYSSANCPKQVKASFHNMLPVP